MKISTFLLLTLISYFSSLALAKLSILSPESLASRFNRKSGLDFRVADFANFPHGAQIVGKLSLANPIDGCHYIDHFREGEFTENIIAVTIRGGGCRESYKAINVEQAGGKVMLLVNDNDILPEFVQGMHGNQQANIPTIIITKSDGEKIIEALKKDEKNEAIISITFPSSTKRETVNVDFWFSASDSYQIASEFLTHLKKVIKDYEDTFIFNPHYVTWTCGKCRVDKWAYSDVDCISGGRYCAPDPDENGPQTGKDIIMEDLRQMCLWSINHDLWWEYVLGFEKKCLKKSDLKKCSDGILNKVANPQQLLALTTCIQDSFIPGNGRRVANQDLDDNKLMKREKALQEDFDVTHFPILYINYKKYNGKVSHVRKVYKELCEQLLVPVDNCLELLESSDEGSRKFKTKKMLKEMGIFMLVSTFFGLIVIWYCRRMGKKESVMMSVEASSMVHDYFAMQDHEPLDEKE